MAHYEPDKIIQLVQLCCWKERTEMSQNGLITLATKLGTGQEDEKRGKKEALNERYIVDLMSDARKAHKEGVAIVKRESYINLLLNFAGFTDWDTWKAALRSPGYFLSPENENFDISGDKPVSVIVPQILEKQLNQTLLFVKKSCHIDLVPSQEPTLIDLAKHVIELLEKTPLIICPIPLSWKDQAVKMRQPSWGEFSGTNRILPVWIDTDAVWCSTAPFLPSVKQEQSTAGLPGVLTGLLFIDNYSQLQTETTKQENASQQATRENGPQFHNSPVGYYMQGATIHNLVTGGDQTINNYFD